MIRPLAIAVLLLLGACADKHPPAAGPVATGRILELAGAGGHVLLKQGEDIRIRLESNRSTGYRWTLLSESPGADVLSLVEEPDYRRSSALPGAGGFETWHFRAIGTGPATLYFTYGRPFEAGKPPARQAVYHFEVR